MRGRSIVDRLLAAGSRGRRLALAALFLLGLLVAYSLIVLRPIDELTAPWWPSTAVWALAFFAARGIPERLVLTMAIAVGATVLNFSQAQDPLVAISTSVLVAIEVGIVGALLPQPRPSDTFGLRAALRIILAVAAGAVFLALGVSGIALSVGALPAEAAAAALRAFASHLSAGVMLLPFPYLSRRFYTTVRRVELAAQVAVTFLVVAVMFLPDDRFSLTFLIFPTLMWLVLRFRTGIVMTEVGAVSFGTAVALQWSTAFDGVSIVMWTPYIQAFWVAIAVTCLVSSALRNEQAASDLQVSVREDLLRGGIIDNHAGFLCLGESVLLPGRLEVLDSSPQARAALREHLAHEGSLLYLRAGSEVERVVAAALADSKDHQATLRSESGRTIAVRSRRVHNPRIGNLAVAEVLDVTQQLAEAEAWERTLHMERASKRQLEELDRQKEVFVGAVNHELRAPVTNILGHADLLSMDPLPEKSKRRAEVIVRNAERLATLVSDVIATTRSADTLPEPNWREVDLVSLVQEAVEDAAPNMRTSKVAVQVAATGPQRVTTGVLEVQQVLENLLDNAVKFAYPATVVSVAVRGESDGVVVEIANLGDPLAPDEQRHVFDRFYRGARAVADAAPGSGVGLTIAEALATRIGGELTLASDPSGVTTVRLRLPRSV
ncbi:sensor histidine kinase [Microbacterium sp. GXF7504]